MNLPPVPDLPELELLINVFELLSLPIVYCLFIGYIFGSIPSGLWIVKSWYNIDIREYGSHNIGATNVFRTVGISAALVVLISDMAKGMAACCIANWIYHMNFLTVIAAIGTIIGHNYSLFLGLKGGKGVATGLGLLVYLMPEVSLIGFGVWLVIVLLTKYVSLGSIVAASLVPILAWAFGYSRSFIALAIVCGLFIIIRHKENIIRLVNGTENKIKVGNVKKL